MPKMQDLPIEPDAVLTREEATDTRIYCKNDLETTADLANTLVEQMELRDTMSEQYGIDLRSKSDAQIAEAVLKAECYRITGKMPERSKIMYTEFKYEPPAYIKFKTPDLKEKLEIIRNAQMVLLPSGHIGEPDEIKKMRITIGQTTYKIGIGGLHSQESEMTQRADCDHYLIDRDVTSYYPQLMLNSGMSPPSFGENFGPVYQHILDERLAAKRSGDTAKAASLKITLNGTFGKTSSRYSMLYSPKMMVTTTMTGQLSLLMLIEALELFGIPVVSANTDGVVFRCPKLRYEAVNKLIAAWERHCKLETEETRYSALHARDVNNYIAVKTDGSVKAKGVYGKPGLMKNPQNTLCSEAVTRFVTEGVPCLQTIMECRDIRKFVTVRTVNGGAVKDGYVLGKAIRWYYGTGIDDEIRYKTNNNIVPRSRGAKPCMDLPKEFPDDINYSWYVKECQEILMSLGVIIRPAVPKIPRKNSKAWKELFETGQIRESDVKRGKWEWVETEEKVA
jgi:hypothetical protein